MARYTAHWSDHGKVASSASAACADDAAVVAAAAADDAAAADAADDTAAAVVDTPAMETAGLCRARTGESVAAWALADSSEA